MRIPRHFTVIIISTVQVLVVSSMIGMLPSANALSADFSTLIGKHVVGYQGWFSCPDDKAKLGWRHWFRGSQPEPNNLVVDMWPDTSELSPGELCPTGLILATGK